jgi:hypothetical protein
VDQDASGQWPALSRDDEGLREELFAILTARVSGDPYSDDGSFAKNLTALPPGLRAMAATHWLDISLTLDSITWHFGNFGEPGLVAATEEGLTELGLHELRACFTEAKELMQPLLADRTEADGDAYEILERNNLGPVGRALDRRAWDLGGAESNDSVIYKAWVRYARAHPERVFGE